MHAMPRGLRLLPLALALAGVPAAHAAESADFQELKAQLQQLKQNYEARIQALEKRLAQAEQSSQQAQQDAGKAQVAVQDVAREVAQSAKPSAPTQESAFNPSLSLILAGNYTRLSSDPTAYRINGFMPSGGEVGPAARNFSLGESELTLAANIDHLFRGQMTVAIAPEGGTTEVEEAFLQTLALPRGWKLKAGRFFSGIGYMNEQHAHTWDFADAPLAYKAFFGNQLAQDGVQVKWLAPLDEHFLELGLEAGQGGAFPGTTANKNGAGMGAAFAHVGGDVGFSNAWRAGLSYVQTHPRNRQFDTEVAGVADSASFSGGSTTTVADFIWKWAPNGDASRRYFKLQGEWMERRENGDLSYANGAGTNGNLDSKQRGWYLQGVYQFQPYWRVGLRHDRLDYGSVTGSATLPDILSPWSPKRSSAMLDWSPSEYSRVRLQYAQDQSRLGEKDHQIWLQYLMSLGSHGAHKF